MRPIVRLLTLACFPLLLAAQSTPPDVAPAINALGLDLYRQQIKSASGQSVLLSPYSIATALAMTYAGADGATQTEMQRVLHFPADAAACSEGFRLLQNQLHDLMLRAGKDVAELRAEGGEATVVTMVTLGMAAGREPPPPPVVRADRPFLFAIQHVESSACLFLGRVIDPR